MHALSRAEKIAGVNPGGGRGALAPPGLAIAPPPPRFLPKTLRNRKSLIDTKFCN